MARSSIGLGGSFESGANRTERLVQFPYEDAAELEKGRSPLPVLAGAVMLQSDWASGRDAGKLSAVDDQLPVESDRQAVAFHDDVEGVPLTDRPIRSDLWCHPGVDLGRKSRIGAIAPYLP